jgi:exonuclease SbcC
MIPARLTLRNFLSYGDGSPPIELEGIGLACLCGENGHGKSSLVDAITWALWGRARGRDLDALIHHGRRHMEVDFEFFAGEARYRVIRRRQRVGNRGAGRPSLEFQVWAGEEWRPLTEPSISHTEQAIERTLKLSYETFVNSALLLQGKADLFTAAGSASRKRILAEILDLGRYDGFEMLAKEARQRRAEEVRGLEQTIEETAGRRSQLPEVERQHAVTVCELAGVAPELARATSELRSVETAQAALERARDQRASLEQDRARESARLQNAEAELASLAAAIAADEPLVAAAPAIRSGYARLRRARAAEQEWSTRLRESRAIEEQAQPLRQTIARSDARLHERLSALRSLRDELARAAAETAGIEERIVRLPARWAALQSREAELEALGRDHERHRERRAWLSGHVARTRELVDELSAQLEDLERASVSGAPICPICGSVADDGHHARLTGAIEARRGAERARIVADEAGIAAAAQESDATGRAMAALREQCLRERAALDAERAAEELLLHQATEAAARFREISAEIEAIGQTASASDGNRLRLRELDAEQAALGYDARRHRDCAQRAERDREYERRHDALVQALARLEASRPAVRTHETMVQEMRARLAETEGRLQILDETVTRQSDLTERLHTLAGHVEALSARQRALHQDLGRLEAALAECQAAQRIETSARDRLKAARAEEGLYADLAVAFGRNGVQAFLIDAVLPEIEGDANRLLAMMTSGRMAVRLETQRQTRAGDLAETLDVIITDEWGTRDYEMYSGGEAFRIDLALRIALSKLLARRAGAPLPTLIIDEGFGSQDAGGRERLMEAVSAIRGDFRCLLVVTHIEELQTMFDTRIEVTKDERGSVARVVRV